MQRTYSITLRMGHAGFDGDQPSCEYEADPIGAENGWKQLKTTRESTIWQDNSIRQAIRVRIGRGHDQRCD